MKNKKKSLIIISSILLVTIFGGIKLILNNNREELKITYTIKENIVFEYGQELTDEDILEHVISFDQSTNDIKLKESQINTKVDISKFNKMVENFKPIENEETTKKIDSIKSNATQNEATKQFLVLKEQGFNFETSKFVGNLVIVVNEKEETINFDYYVLDTQKPTLTEIEDTYEYSFEEELTYIDTIKGEDSIDGKLNVSFEPTLKKGDIGTHKVTATVVDKNSNVSAKEFTVTIKEKSVIVTETEKPNTNSNSSNIPSNNNSNSNSGNVITNTGGTQGSNSNNNSGNTDGGNNSNKPTKPTTPSYVCATGTDKNRPCEDWVDSSAHMAYSHHASMDSCKAVGYDIEGQYWEIEGKDVSRFACTQLKNNGGTGYFFRLSLIHDGDNGSYWLNSNKKWVK